MSNAFSWDQFQNLEPSYNEGMSKESFDWNQFESIPRYDAYIANKDQEGSIKAGFRNIFQIPKGRANLTFPGAALNTLGTMGTAEALSGLENELSEENIARLREMFPNAPWENFDSNHEDYDSFRKKYLEGTQEVSSFFPTVENISRGLENLTDIPLASTNIGHELIQLGTGLGTGLLEKLTSQPSKFSNIANKVMATAKDESSIANSLQNQLGKKFSQGEIIAEGRRLGMSDAEIAPLLNSERRMRFVSKFANKGQRSQTAISRSYDKIGQAYETLKNSELAANPFSSTLKHNTLSNLYKELKDLPDIVRQGIVKDTELLLKEPNLTASNLINYRQKVQKVISSDPKKYGPLSQVKKVIDDAILKSNPKLAKEYHGINRLYEQYAKISSAMKPGLVDKFISKGEALAGLYGIMTLNLPWLGKVVGESTARRLATELLINPRFQQLNSKIINALNKNKLGMAADIAQDIAREIRPYSDDLADEIEEIDWHNF